MNARTHSTACIRRRIPLHALALSLLLLTGACTYTAAAPPRTAAAAGWEYRVVSHAELYGDTADPFKLMQEAAERASLEGSGADEVSLFELPMRTNAILAEKIEKLLNELAAEGWEPVVLDLGENAPGIVFRRPRG